MALTRKSLKAMGLTDEQVDSIIEAHTETVDALKDERDRYREDADKLAEVQKELDAAKKSAKDAPDYAALKKEYDEYKKSVEAEKSLQAKKAAFEDVVKDAGLSEKGIAKALKYADWDSIELTDTGKVKDAMKHIKALREEWSDYVVTEGEEGADTDTPPENKGGAKMTREEILAIKDTAERQKAMAENHELFGI